MNKFFYIAETDTTTLSAYIIHVLKMCDAFILNNTNTTCILPYQVNNNHKTIKKNFLLRGKEKINFISIFKSKKKNNFINRFFFSLRTALFLKKRGAAIILTRSQLSSFFLSFFKIRHFLEIHGELNGFSKYVLLNLNFINSKYIIRNIFISKQLKKLHFKEVKNFIILPDAVDIKNFPKIKKINKLNKFCYIGNFYEGRGLKKIYDISKSFPKYIFHLYGKKKNNFEIKNTQNLKIFDYVNYNLVPDLLSKYDVLLMPYENKVMINSKNLDTSKYMSPLKMFDYLASGKIIISSNQKVLQEILEHNTNSFIVTNNDLNGWLKTISMVLKFKNLNKISKNARQTAHKFTWYNRANIIKKIYMKQIK